MYRTIQRATGEVAYPLGPLRLRDINHGEWTLLVFQSIKELFTQHGGGIFPPCYDILSFSDQRDHNITRTLRHAFVTRDERGELLTTDVNAIQARSKQSPIHCGATRIQQLATEKSIEVGVCGLEEVETLLDLVERAKKFEADGLLGRDSYTNSEPLEMDRKGLTVDPFPLHIWRRLLRPYLHTMGEDVDEVFEKCKQAIEKEREWRSNFGGIERLT